MSIIILGFGFGAALVGGGSAAIVTSAISIGAAFCAGGSGRLGESSEDSVKRTKRTTQRRDVTQAATSAQITAAASILADTPTSPVATCTTDIAAERICAPRTAKKQWWSVAV